MDSRTIHRVAAAWSALALVSVAAGQACDADLDGDGQVSGTDLSVVLAGWGPCITVPAWATLIEAVPDPAVVHDAELRAAIAATGLPWRVLDTATQLELVLVPPATFQQGCSSSLLYSCTTREVPVHQVTLTQPFYIARFKITQAQWQARMGSNPSDFQQPSVQVPADQVPNRPVEQVSWIMVQEFLSGTGLRLPTESEGEIAYHAGTTTAYQSLPGYPGGTNDEVLLDEISWYFRDSVGQTDPTGPASGSFRVIRGARSP